eukprot:12420952-Heterocapsa_arctica.AAC.1
MVVVRPRRWRRVAGRRPTACTPWCLAARIPECPEILELCAHPAARSSRWQHRNPCPKRPRILFAS